MGTPSFRDTDSCHMTLHQWSFPSHTAMTLNNICDFRSSDSTQLGKHVLTLKINVLTAIFSSTVMVGLFTLLPIYNTTWNYIPVHCDLGAFGSAVG